MRKLSIVLAFVMLVAGFQFTFAAGKTITMWTFAPNNLAEWTNNRAAIEKKFGITLDIQLIAQDAYIQKLQAVMMDGKGVPDIIEWMIENNQILNADPKKCLVTPLESFATPVFNAVPKGRVAFVKYGEHIYGLPHDVHPLVMIYNDTLWQAVGVDVAKIKTWDEFFEASKKLTKEQKDGKPVHYALPSQNGGLGDTMWMLWQTSGSQILTKDGKPNFTSPAFADFVKKWKGWYETGAFVTWDWGNFGAMLKNGTLASYTSPDWWVSQVDAAAKDGTYKFKVRDLPVYKTGGPNTGSWGGTFLAIPKTVKNPAEIYKIVEFMQYEKEFLLSRYPVSGMVPPNPALYSDPSFQKPDPRFGGQKLGVLQTSLAVKEPEITTGDIFWQAINDFGTTYPDMMTGKVTIDDGLKIVQAAAEKRIVK
jgi:arabinosaccharide transport system substrate-binding protein